MYPRHERGDPVHVAVITWKIRCRTLVISNSSAITPPPNTSPAMNDEKTPVSAPTAVALDDSGQPDRCRAEWMTVKKTAHAGDQEGNHSGSNRRGKQHAQSVTGRPATPLGRSPAKPILLQMDDHRDDRDHRAQCAHDRSLCQLTRAQRSTPRVPKAGRSHLTDFCQACSAGGPQHIGPSEFCLPRLWVIRLA